MLEGLFIIFTTPKCILIKYVYIHVYINIENISIYVYIYIERENISIYVCLEVRYTGIVVGGIIVKVLVMKVYKYIIYL